MKLDVVKTTVVDTTGCRANVGNNTPVNSKNAVLTLHVSPVGTVLLVGGLPKPGADPESELPPTTDGAYNHSLAVENL